MNFQPFLFVALACGLTSGLWTVPSTTDCACCPATDCALAEVAGFLCQLPDCPCECSDCHVPDSTWLDSGLMSDDQDERSNLIVGITSEIASSAADVSYSRCPFPLLTCAVRLHVFHCVQQC